MLCLNPMIFLPKKSTKIKKKYNIKVSEEHLRINKKKMIQKKVD